MMMQGRKAVITGGSRGIGLAIAKTFASNGASKLTLIGRNLDSLQQAKATLNNCGNSEISLCQGNVSSREFWIDVAKEAKDTDLLVNSAGIGHASLFVSTSPSLVEDVYQTNLLGTTWGCQIIGKAMIRQRRAADDPACIINVGSLFGAKGGRGSVAYATTKAGILGLTRSLALELGPSNIRVNALVPGFIDTMMTEAMHPDSHAEARQSIPQKRFGTPEEVAHAALFLATNAYANNCVLNLDGALSAT